MKKSFSAVIVFVLFALVVSACAPAPQAISPTLTSQPELPTSTSSPVPPTHTPSLLPPTFTPSPIPPTFTPEPTSTETLTPTPEPQQILLRRKCGHNYIVNSDQPLQIFYGGWAVKGTDLATQWTTAMTVTFTLDGVEIPGELQQPSHELPFNCTTHSEDTYWLYYMTVIPGLSAGEHEVTATISSLRALSDGSGVYGPGDILTQTFTITTR